MSSVVINFNLEVLNLVNENKEKNVGRYQSHFGIGLRYFIVVFCALKVTVKFV